MVVAGTLAVEGGRVVWCFWTVSRPHWECFCCWEQQQWKLKKRKVYKLRQGPQQKHTSYIASSYCTLWCIDHFSWMVITMYPVWACCREKVISVAKCPYSTLLKALLSDTPTCCLVTRAQQNWLNIPARTVVKVNHDKWRQAVSVGVYSMVRPDVVLGWVPPLQYLVGLVAKVSVEAAYFAQHPTTYDDDP